MFQTCRLDFVPNLNKILTQMRFNYKDKKIVGHQIYIGSKLFISKDS